jgi:hypothetical protein
MMLSRYLKPLDEHEILCNGFVSLGLTVRCPPVLTAFGNYHRMLFDLILQFRIQ